jgi:hypothetical protein
MGDRYRVSWEMPSAVRSEWEWHRTEKEHDSLVEAVDQYLALKGWETTGEEPIRNVKLEKATVEWKDTYIPQWILDKVNENARNDGH